MASFSVPLSGLQASSSELDVIGNNLANLNTDGFKDQTLSFGDIFSQMQGTSGNGDPIQIGSGVQIEATSSNFTNGSVKFDWNCVEHGAAGKWILCGEWEWGNELHAGR